MPRWPTAALHGVVGALLLLAPGAGAEPPAFDGSRAALAIPDAVWERVLRDAGRPGGALGYGAEELRAFGRDAHLLRSVQAAFADVRRLPRETGRLTDGLLENAAKPSEVLARGWTLTDVWAGRMYAPPEGLRWGLEELETATTPREALERLSGGPARGDLAAVPVAAQRLLLRLWVGLVLARPWVKQSRPPANLFTVTPETLEPDAPSADPIDLSLAQHRAATAPFVDEWHGQSATFRPAAFEWLASVRREPLAYGSIVLAVHLERALEEYRAAPPAEREGGALEKPVRLGPAGAEVVVYGTGPDAVDRAPGDVLTLDLGGDDAWSGTTAATFVGDADPDTALSLHVDLGGDDRYVSEAPASLACGLFGVAFLVDLAGDDLYEAGRSGLGCGLFGAGVLLDAAGNDAYRSKGPWGQGSGHAGVGALIDLAGDDDYECVEQAQGLGGTLGAGLLIDLAGNDAYVARDDGNVSALYLNQSVAMAQGCGYGRRADLGDGRSLAGGVGVLVDGAGDDRYHAQVWAQGCGYWWALGVLEDRAGDDQYQNGKYSAGAAAHFALGVLVDLAGDDVHNAANPGAKNQWQGHARDGSVGLFVDGDGDDGYDLNNHCAGAADLNSIGLFWDRRGDDRYTFHDKALGPANGWNDTGAFGVASRYPPFRSFRDDLPSWGVFLDTGGRDSYAVETAPTTFPATPAADGSTWVTAPGPRSFGLGYDLEGLYPRPAR